MAQASAALQSAPWESIQKKIDTHATKMKALQKQLAAKRAKFLHFSSSQKSM